MDLVPIHAKRYTKEITQGGGQMRPPPGFVAQVQRYDRALLVGFSVSVGRKEPLGRWVIARKRRTGPGIAHILTVETPDGHYMGLGSHVLETLKKLDSWRIGLDETLRRLDAVHVQETKARSERIKAPLLAGIDKLAWATRKDFESYSTAHISKESMVAHDRKLEERRAALAIR